MKDAYKKYRALGLSPAYAIRAARLVAAAGMQ
jgi:hypothetical protein